MLYAKSVRNRLIAVIPVCMVIALITLIYGSFYSCYILKKELTMPRIGFYILFHLILALNIWSYIKTLSTNPGNVPAHYSHDEYEKVSSIGFMEEDLKVAMATFCKKCNFVRPPRAHHCRLCERCILKMDHHCPWVGNCVGFYNHRYFTQFLVYSSWGCIVVGSLLGNEVLELGYEAEGLVIVGAIAGCMAGMGILGLASYHIYNLLTNLTSLEMRMNPEFRVFDKGSWLSNLESIAGGDVLTWFLPLPYKPHGQGFIYSMKLRGKQGEFWTYDDKIILDPEIGKSPV